MSNAFENANFDIQAAWLRRFHEDAESNLQAFALRLKEALPEHVIIHETKPLLFGKAKITGVSINTAESKYSLEIVKGRLNATISLVVREIALNTKKVDPAEWFAKLAAETQHATEHAKSLSESLSAFMAS